MRIHICVTLVVMLTFIWFLVKNVLLLLNHDIKNRPSRILYRIHWREANSVKYFVRPSVCVYVTVRCAPIAPRRTRRDHNLIIAVIFLFFILLTFPDINKKYKNKKREYLFHQCTKSVLLSF